MQHPQPSAGIATVPIPVEGGMFLMYRGSGELLLTEIQQVKRGIASMGVPVPAVSTWFTSSVS